MRKTIQATVGRTNSRSNPVGGFETRPYEPLLLDTASFICYNSYIINKEALQYGYSQ
jgi:hypothetical protein